MMVVAHDAATVTGVETRIAALLPGCDEGLVPVGNLRRLAEGVFRLGAPLL